MATESLHVDQLCQVDKAVKLLALLMFVFESWL